MVTTYRPDELHRRHPLRPLLAELERDARARRVELHPLTRAELAEQLADILGAAPREDLLDRLFARSEGNPLFAEELLAAGMDGRGALPPTLRDALMLRIERLSEDAQELLRLLAAGRRLDHQILADASGEDSRVLREALREAVAAQLVVPDEEGFYAFRHALLREVVVDDLLPGERAELHLALARALERRAEGLPDHGGAHLAAGIAHHYLESGDQPAALAASRSRRRGRRGRPRQRRGRGAVLARAEAVGSRGGRRGARPAATTSSCCAPPRGRRAASTSRRAPRRCCARRWPRSATRPGAHGRGCSRCSRGQQFDQGRSAEAAETRRDALDLLPDEPSETRATLLASLTKDLMMESRYREAVEAARGRARGRAAPPATRSRRSARSTRMGVALFGLGALRRGRAGAARGDAPRGGGRASAPAPVAPEPRGVAGGGRPAGRGARDRRRGRSRSCSERGSPRRWLALMRSELAFEAGDWAAAEAALPSPGRPAMGMTFVNEALRRIELALGRGDHETRAHAARPGGGRRRRQRASRSGSGRWARCAPSSSGAPATWTRRATAIEDALDRLDFCSQDVARMARVAATGVRVEADAAVRARDLGEDPSFAIAMAEGLIARVQACAEGERPVEAAFLASARAEQARAEDRDDPDLWTAAVGAWEALGRPYRAAQAQRRKAEALLAQRRSRRAAAAAALEALEAAQAIGAAWLASEIEGFALRARLRLEPDEPSPAPAQTATDAGEDPFGLTPRERQVLALLADGRTNREIGQALYMAEKTASVHVSRILSKLDVRSRTEAAAVAHRVGLV